MLSRQSVQRRKHQYISDLIDLNYKQPRRGLKSWFNFDFAILDDNTFSDRDQFKWPVFVRFFLTSVSERLFIQTQILGFS